jgi:CRISPR-associated exonuclease Cas4
VNFSLRVSDIRQHLYCPRIPYYSYVVPVDRHETFKMVHGRDVHNEIERLERRRTLARYGLEAGERLFRVQLSSERLKLNGTLDLLIRTDREDVPVEFKYTLGDVMSHHKYQLAAYALLVEEHFGRPVRRGVLAILPANRIRWIAVTEGVRRYVNRLLREIRASIARQLMAPPVRRCGRCRDCEFRYYCHDIY